MVPVVTSQLCCQPSQMAAGYRQYTNKQKWLCSNKALFIKTDGGPDLAYSL